MTDATLLAEHMIWAATTENAGCEAYNVVNGDIFRCAEPAGHRSTGGARLAIHEVASLPAALE